MTEPKPAAVKKKPGPRKGVKKVKLIPPSQRKEVSAQEQLETAAKNFAEKGIGYAAFYGVDEDNARLINQLWSNLNITRLIACDPLPHRLNNFSREISKRSFSLNRWFPLQVRGFISDQRYPFIIVAEDLYDEVKAFPYLGSVELTTYGKLSRGVKGVGWTKD